MKNRTPHTQAATVNITFNTTVSSDMNLLQPSGQLMRRMDSVPTGFGQLMLASVTGTFTPPQHQQQQQYSNQYQQPQQYSNQYQQQQQYSGALHTGSAHTAASSNRLGPAEIAALSAASQPSSGGTALEEISVGTQVQIFGMATHKEYEGLFGRVTKNLGDEKYTVKLSNPPMSHRTGQGGAIGGGGVRTEGNFKRKNLRVAYSGGEDYSNGPAGGGYTSGLSQQGQVQGQLADGSQHQPNQPNAGATQNNPYGASSAPQSSGSRAMGFLRKLSSGWE